MPRVHKTPSAMTSTAEEDQFFAKDKAASRAAETEEAQDETEEQRGAAGEAEQPEEEGASETEGESGAGDQEAEPAGADAEEAPGRTVPIGEVFAEREKRKAAEALQKQQAERISQLEETFRRVVDRIGGLQHPQQQAPAQQDVKIPSYEEDPLAHLKATQELLVRQIGGTSQWTQQQQLEQQLQAHIYASENEFRAAHPDYDAAAAYAQNLRVRELSLLTNDPVQVTNALRQDIFSIAARAQQTGRNPAELYYEYAKLRGYQPQQEQVAQPQQKPQSGNGAQRLKQIAAAQAVSKAPKGGTAPQAAVTLSDLSTMTDDEFDKNFDKFWKQT